MVPNEVEEDFNVLKQFYDDGQIVEIVATIGLFGYLNRWNDTMATQIEVVPGNVAKRTLSDWQEGKHN